MNNKITCAIIKDLLPSYIDGLTSEETNEAIQEHLASCPECRKTLNHMCPPEDSDTSESSAGSDSASTASQAEVDYLKKVRRMGRRRTWGIVLTTLAVGLFLVLFRFFYLGKDSSDSSILFYHNTKVEENTLSLDLGIMDSITVITRTKIKEDNGIVNITVYTSPFSSFHSGDSHISYTAKEEIRQVRMGERILWSDGQAIDAKIARLYSAKTPYVGNASATTNIAALLDIHDSINTDYVQHYLQTATEPYGWVITVYPDKIYPLWSDGTTRFYHSQMISDSCTMLALVENLGYVTWKYEAGDSSREHTITTEMANEMTGMDVKACYDSITEFQQLIHVAQQIEQKLSHVDLLQ